jgi:glyoxylase-like metal-dependent hydrolase (beta-lactamase superfamily II)
VSKEPRLVLDSIWAFPPNRETLGGTAYLIVNNLQNILIDCPSWSDETQAFLNAQGGVQGVAITHRQGMSSAVQLIQSQFGCSVWVQEQEAYLLPDVTVTAFQHECELTPHIQAFWTPGYSPGSCCIYSRLQGGVLFTGRHILPHPDGDLGPLRTAKTFHWGRQLNSIQMIVDRFDDESLHFLCPGSNIGFLRQQRYVDQAYQKIRQLDVLALQQIH